jgi:hypothetical protein
MGLFGEFIICNMFTIIYKFTILYWDYSEFIDYPTEHVIHWEFFFPYSIFKWDCTLSTGTLQKNGISSMFSKSSVSLRDSRRRVHRRVSHGDRRLHRDVSVYPVLLWPM